MIKTLAIETSCDDTSLSIVSFDGEVFAVEQLLAYSQIDDHQKYGGVVPEFASRLHSEKIIAVLQKIGRDAIAQVDFISVTTHPGLPGSLVVGKAVAHFLARQFAKPLEEVNHVYGHLFSLFLERNVKEIQLPMVVLTASGGHNDIYLVEGSRSKVEAGEQNIHHFGGYAITKLGHTLDDAAGECFDKVSRMLGGPYPGGQWISMKAEAHKLIMQNVECRMQNDGIDIVFKRIFLSHDGYDFSFSGMKSQVSFLLKELEKKGIALSEELICAIAYEFQEAVVEVLAKKLLRAAIAYEAKTVGVAGGVSCNDRLWEYVEQYGQEKLPTARYLKPIKKVYSMDNGAMIGLAGILQWNQK